MDRLEYSENLVRSHSWQKVPNPLFYQNSAYPTFFKLSNAPFPPPPLLFLLHSFTGSLGDHTKFDILFYLMILWIYTCYARKTFLCVLYNKASILLRSDTSYCFLLARFSPLQGMGGVPPPARNLLIPPPTWKSSTPVDSPPTKG